MNENILIHADICSTTSHVVFTTQKKAFNENPAASTYFTCRTCQLNLYIIRFILKQNVFVVFCECTRNIHYTCIIDIRNVFQEALAIQNSTTILLTYNMGKCVGNPENLIIDHVIYEKWTNPYKVMFCCSLNSIDF